jgi:hypothetical protein
VYWYFTFADRQKQGISNLLSSTVLQLLSQRAHIPKNILDAYKKSARGILPPSINDLLEMFHKALNVFKDIYLVIDALDDCPKAEQSREHLLEILDKIIGWKEESLHILITSRREKLRTFRTLSQIMLRNFKITFLSSSKTTTLWRSN